MISPLWLVTYTKTILMRISISCFCCSQYLDVCRRSRFKLATSIVRTYLAWLQLGIWKLRGKEVKQKKEDILM